MIGLLQRVDAAQVAVEGAVIGSIQRGLLVLVGVEAGDGEAEADRLLERLVGYRVFPDGDGKMNLSLRDIGGGRVGGRKRGPACGDLTPEARKSPRLELTRLSPLPGRTYR